MKEKRVDICLAKAAFFQIIFIGLGGAFLAEVIKYDGASVDILIGSAIPAIASISIIINYYSKASRFSRKK